MNEDPITVKLVTNDDVDALDRLEAWNENGLTVQLVMDLGVAVDAARRVANPDMDAAIAKHNELYPVRLSARGEGWQRQIVFAALGITMEDE